MLDLENAICWNFSKYGKIMQFILVHQYFTTSVNHGLLQLHFLPFSHFPPSPCSSASFPKDSDNFTSFISASLATNRFTNVAGGYNNNFIKPHSTWCKPQIRPKYHPSKFWLWEKVLSGRRKELGKCRSEGNRKKKEGVGQQCRREGKTIKGRCRQWWEGI